MALPKVPQAHRTVDVEGVLFDIRGLTRAEAAKLQKMVSDDRPGGELEIAMVAFGTDTPIDEVEDWYSATPAGAVGELLEAIRDLSKLDEGARKSG